MQKGASDFDDTYFQIFHYCFFLDVSGGGYLNYFYRLFSNVTKYGGTLFVYRNQTLEAVSMVGFDFDSLSE